MRATIRTRHDDPAMLAAALDPDHTESMQTTVADDEMITVVERPTSGGLRATVDDYLVNLRVADRTQTTMTTYNHETQT